MRATARLALSGSLLLTLYALWSRQGSLLFLRVISSVFRDGEVIFVACVPAVACRSRAHTANSGGLSTYSEDTDGTAVNVNSRHMPWALGTSTEELNVILPLGSIFAVCEPALREHLHEDKTKNKTKTKTKDEAEAAAMPVVEIYSATDFLFLTEGHGLPSDLTWRDSFLPPSARPETHRSPKACKRRSNTLAAKGWLDAAKNAFTRGIDIEDAPAVRLKRGQLRLRLGRPRSAEADVASILARDRSTLSAGLVEKALLLSAMAAKDLRRWDQAKTRVAQLLALCPSSLDGRE